MDSLGFLSACTRPHIDSLEGCRAGCNIWKKLTALKQKRICLFRESNRTWKHIDLRVNSAIYERQWFYKYFWKWFCSYSLRYPFITGNTETENCKNTEIQHELFWLLLFKTRQQKTSSSSPVMAVFPVSSVSGSSTTELEQSCRAGGTDLPK